MVIPFSNLYSNKRVLVTGHTGFKGGWLSIWLRQLGAQVSGLALPPQAGDSLFSLLEKGTFENSWFKDLRDAEAMKKAIVACQPDIIFHLAAQPIVGVSYRAPLDTFTSNAVGTAVLLEAVRETKCAASVVVVTSDKCYRNDNSGRPFVETDPLGGHDVYSMSKAATELVVASWHASFFSKDDGLGALATGRAGNVIGGGDYAEDRIVPDAVRSFIHGKSLLLRRPEATRPWQHVLESLSGYLALGQRLLTGRKKNELLNFNFGPDFESERSVKELVDGWLEAWPDAFVLETEPQAAYNEATRLSLDHSLATEQLGWRPVWDFARTVSQTAAWYRQRHEFKDVDDAMLTFTKHQISTYVNDAVLVGAAWTK